MPLTVFYNAYFLASLGWAIANSLWQAGVLWMVYKFLLNINRNMSALFKYYCSNLFLLSSFVWFAITLIENYFLFKHSPPVAINLFGTGKLIFLQNIITALPYFSIIYISLLVLFSAKFILHYTNLRFLKNNGLQKAPVDIRLFAGKIALQVGIKKNVLVWLSDKVDVPSVIGCIKPVILLPVAVISQLSSSQVETILLHELAHIKRNDFLVNLMQAVIELLLFFNPFVKLLANESKKERENCCDDWVLNYQYNKYDYASALLHLEKNRSQQHAFIMAATNGENKLLKRIKRLFAAVPYTEFKFHQKIQITGLSLLLAFAMLAAIPLCSSEKNMPINTPSNTAKYAGNSSPVVIEKLPAMLFANNRLIKKPGIKKLKSFMKSPIIKATENIEDADYSFALVNEELLKKNKELANLATGIAYKEASITKEIVVKIEEEESGKKQKNTYYLQVTNKEGQIKIEPLLLLNKFHDTTSEKKMQPVIIKKAGNKKVTS